MASPLMTAISPLTMKLTISVEVFVLSGDNSYSIQGNLHRFYLNFEHEIDSGGGSGGSGGIFSYLFWINVWRGVSYN